MIEIEVLLNDAPFATRYWAAVPRMGELVTLRNPSDGKQFLVRVKQVQWNEKASAKNAQPEQLVHLFCEVP